MYWLETMAWLGLAAIHVLPALAALMPGGLGRFYGIKTGNALLLLLEHRTIVFAAIVIGCIWAVLDPQPRPAVFLFVALSVLGYLALYIKHAMPKGALRKVAIVDLAAVPLLGVIAFRLL